MLLLRQEKQFHIAKIVGCIAQTSEKQLHKYIKFNFSQFGLQLSTMDDQMSFFVGLKIKKQIFTAYICEKDTSILLPILKMQKILKLPCQPDDSLTVTYQSPKNQIVFRISSTKNNLKTMVGLQIFEKSSDMVNEKYQQPSNPLDILDQINYKSTELLQNDANINPMLMKNNWCQFIIAREEFKRICKQFNQVSKTIDIGFYSQANKKYLTLTAMTGNGPRAVTLSQQKSQQEIGMQQSFQMMQQGRQVRGTFMVKDLYRIATIGNKQNEQVLGPNLKFILVKQKSATIVFDILEDIGQLGCMVSAVVPTSIL